MAGITAFGAYVPRLRLQRGAIAQANTWFDTSLGTHAKGERAMGSWDEDTVTMAVEALRDMAQQRTPDALFLASTTLPFADRQNAGIVAEALNQAGTMRTMDVAGSQRASATALLAALDGAAAGRTTAVVAAEKRQTRVGTVMEMLSGDAAAAVTVGTQGIIAEVIGSASVTTDFVDHFRASGEDFDYDWEERWVRDEGWMKIVPEAVAAALADAGINADEVQHFIVPCHLARVPPGVAKACGITAHALSDNLLGDIGHAGVAHPLLMLAAVLAQAEPEQHIVLTAFGQGCDAIVLKTTGHLAAIQPLLGVAGWRARRIAEDNYAKFLTYNDLVEREFGKRAELDRSPALTVQYRNRRGVLGFVGGRCTQCGTVQYPKSNYCVNPNCGAADAQEDHPMADVPAKVKTWTADRLVFAMDPPAYFGLVEFEGGGRTMVDFAEVNPETFDVGATVTMRFRIKFIDKRRGMRQYFWKAIP